MTAFVTRAVKPGREADYEAWLHRLLADAAELPGYLGAEIHPPAAGPGPVVYTSVVHFDGPDSLRQFEQSDMRRGHLAEVTDLVAGDAVWGRRTGLDLWFPPPLGTTAPHTGQVVPVMGGTPATAGPSVPAYA